MGPVSKAELQRLPLLAIVALTARAAKRVWAGFDLPGDDPERVAHRSAVDRAIEVAEAVAGGLPLPPDAQDIAGDASTAAEGAPATAAAFAAYAADRALSGDPEAVIDLAVVCLRSVPPGDVGAVRGDYLNLLDLGLGHFPERGDPVDVSDGGPLGPV
jgi:hypothetical protein